MSTRSSSSRATTSCRATRRVHAAPARTRTRARRTQALRTARRAHCRRNTRVGALRKVLSPRGAAPLSWLSGAGQAYCADVEASPCKFCLHPKTNLCQAVRAWTGRGVMKADNASRFTYNGQPVFHFMGTSTFSEYTGAARARVRACARACVAAAHVC